MKKLYINSLCYVLDISILCILLSGCFPSVSTKTQETTTQSTATLPSPLSLTHPVTKSSTSQVNIDLNNKCTNIVSSANMIMDGSIILKSMFTNDGSIIDMRSGSSIPLGQIFPNIAVSSDLTKAAFVIEETHQLIILDAQVNPVETKTIPTRFGGVVRWVDNESLLLEKFVQNPYQEASSVLYNLGSGEEKEYGFDYPDISVSNEIRWGNYGFTRAVYDHFFSRVLYPAWDGRDNSLVLRDIDNQREIIRWYGGYQEMGSAPQWLKDGSQFFVGIPPKFLRWKNNIPYENYSDGYPYLNGYDLFRVSRDGEMERLTYLTTKYNAAEEAISLSPNEKHIAFWLNLNFPNNETRQLAMLELETGKVTNLCFTGGDLLLAPIWSPNSENLAVTIYHVATRSSEVFIIDINKGLAFKIGENVDVKGWIVAPP